MSCHVTSYRVALYHFRSHHVALLSGLRPGAADPFLGAEGQRARNSVQKTFNKGGAWQGASESKKKNVWQSFGKAHSTASAGLSWAGWAGLG